MDNLPSQVTPPFPKLLFIIPVIIFLISVLISFFVSKKIIEINYQSKSYPLISNTNLSIKFDLLQNSILSNWSGHIQGRVISKTNNSFILMPVSIEYSASGGATIKDGSSSDNMKVIFIASKTSFKDNSKVVNFANLKVGSIVNGIVEIYKSGNKGTAIGREFIVQ